MEETLREGRPYVLSILRIVAALLFLEHGTQKIFGFPEAKYVPEAFTLGWIAGWMEIIGGALLIVGLFTRATAFLLSGQMAVAYWMAHAPNNVFPVLNGGDAAILFCFVFLYLVFAGPGPWSLDARREAR
ncbi:MAG: DoxX family protein [Thermomicrobiales bacterium]